MNQLDELQKSLTDATEGFKQMQIALLAFAAVAALGLLMASIAIFRQK